ncbi:MAG: AAA family ATPase [Bacilli bacterium]|nr:AAA family ATPase [Bacilli bacterium]MDD4795585.1 AAA family ATPase [Bacilli bacterium]
MLKRKIMDDLIKWKNSGPDKQCLLVKGARQVGKTYIIEQFIKANYKNYILINFELMPEYKSIFDGNLDIITLKKQLELNFPTVNLEANNVILFLDEIQACPNARVALKTFALDGTIDVIASGSLLGLYFKEVRSYPVGYEIYYELKSLDFEEYLWAVGIKEEYINECRKAFLNKEKIDDFYLDIFTKHFREYLIVGGMPEVVKKYLNTKSFTAAGEVQDKIMEAYLLDISKYAGLHDKPKIVDVLRSVPVQLAKKNKRFVFAEINNEKNIGTRKYISSLEWLKDAGIINFCYNLTQPAAPLMSNIILNTYKIYVQDVGLLVSMLDSSIKLNLLNEDLYINEGSIIENVCAMHLSKRKDRLTYFEKKSKLEIDFVLNINGEVTAIEVKSGNNKKAKSLDSIIQNYKTVSRYMMFELDTNIYIDEKKVEHYPLFMIMFIE